MLFIFMAWSEKMPEQCMPLSDANNIVFFNIQQSGSALIRAVFSVMSFFRRVTAAENLRRHAVPLFKCGGKIV